MSPPITAHAIGLIDGRDLGRYRYKITAATPEAYEIWVSKLKASGSFIREISEHWFVFDFDKNKRIIWSNENMGLCFHQIIIKRLPDETYEPFMNMHGVLDKYEAEPSTKGPA